jgi:hypothetical protein
LKRASTASRLHMESMSSLRSQRYSRVPSCTRPCRKARALRLGLRLWLHHYQSQGNMSNRHRPQRRRETVALRYLRLRKRRRRSSHSPPRRLRPPRDCASRCLPGWCSRKSCRDSMWKCRRESRQDRRLRRRCHLRHHLMMR